MMHWNMRRQLRARERMRRRLFVLAVLTIQVQTGRSSSPSWQDPSRRGRPDAPGYHYRGETMRNGDEADRRNGYQTDRRYEDGYAQEPPSRQTPPPPPESESSYTPIHYPFRAADEKPPMDPSKSRNRPSDDVPRTELDRPQPLRENDDRTYASPRDDIVTRYMANKRGRIMLTLSSGMMGMSIGSFVGKSLMNNPRPVGLSFFILFIVCTFLRNPYGELSRALGMALILALQRTQYIRRKYPAWPHIKACIGAGPRVPTDQEDYNALYAVIAMAFVGFACGGSLPLLPTWMGAMAGGAALSFLTTLPTSNGDLARTMGMRVVSLFEEVLSINSDLKMMSKVGIVSGKVLDKVLVLDRKHRIKDRLIAAFSWAYEQVSRTAEQVQTDMRDEEAPRDGDRRSEPRRSMRDDEPPREGDRRSEPRRQLDYSE